MQNLRQQSETTHIILRRALRRKVLPDGHLEREYCEHGLSDFDGNHDGDEFNGEHRNEGLGKGDCGGGNKPRASNCRRASHDNKGEERGRNSRFMRFDI